MSESVTQKNLALFSEMLMELNKASIKAFNRGRNFLPIYNTYRVQQPYIDNLVLYCNQYLDGNIDITNNQPQELLELVQANQQKIENIHNLISQQNFSDINCNFYTKDALNELGELLAKIDQQTEKQKVINRYFMRGMLEAAVAVMLNRRQNSEVVITKNINESEIPERMISLLAEQGISMNDENESSVYEILYQECGELISKRTPIHPKELSKSIAHTMHEYFSVNEKNLRKDIEKDTEILCGFIKDAKVHMRRHQAVVRELMLFSQNIEFIPHEKVENYIYTLSTSDMRESELKEKWSSGKSLPKYLLPFAKTPEVLSIMQQMPQWEKYEQNSQNFDKDEIYGQASLMSLSLIKSIYREFDEYEEILDDLSEIKEDEEEDNIKKIDSNTTEKEKSLLDFVERLISATAMVEKYSQLHLNNTGIDNTTIDRMRHKNNLNSQDINVLGEIISAVDANVDDCLDIINMAVIPDYAETLQMVEKMPHGKEKQEMLTCLMTSMDATLEDICEDLEKTVFDIDCQIGHQTPELENKIKKLFEDSEKQYPEITSELIEKIHEGVVISYLLPCYNKKIPYNGTEAELAAAYIDEYEDLPQETQDYIQQICQYYGEKIVEAHNPEVIRKNQSPKLQENIMEFYNCQFCIQEIDDMQQSVEEMLKEEKKLSAAYHKYKIQKEKFEMPENIDIVLASVFNNAKQRK